MDKSKHIKKVLNKILPIGTYIPQKGTNNFLQTNGKKMYWTVKTGNGSYYDVKTQTEAELVSRMVIVEKRIITLERTLNKLLTILRKYKC